MSAGGLEVQLQIQKVPLPPDRRAAWIYAMQLLDKYALLAAQANGQAIQTQSSLTAEDQLRRSYILEFEMEEL